MNSSDLLSLNLYTYCHSNPILYFDPSGHLKVKQYASFAWQFAQEAASITVGRMGGSIWHIPGYIEQAQSFLTLAGDLFAGKYSASDVLKAVGQNIWDSLTGDLRWLFSNLDWFSPNKELTKNQVTELANRTAGAWAEGASIIMTIVAAVQAFQRYQVAKSDIMSNKTYTNTTSTGVSNYTSKTTGIDAAKADFNKLNPTNVRTYSNGTIVGDLPGGRTVNIHIGTSTSGPTLEIFDPTAGTRIKIRY